MDSGDYSNPFVGPVVDLVDPYATKDEAAAAAGKLMAWMDDHPGRWVLFYEGGYGISRENIPLGRYEVARRGTKLVEKVYARLRHPEGESLNDALARRPAGAAVFPNDLPGLGEDEFKWTKEELQEACELAREKLFPVRASRSAKGGRK